MAGNEGLVDEVAKAMGSTSDRGAVARWIESDRRRLLPYVAVGGTFVGLLAGVRGAGLHRGDRGSLVVGLATGIAIGMTVGWVVLGAARGLPLQGRSRTTLRLVRAALSIPPYVAAGFAALLATLVVGGAADRIPSAIPGTLVGLGGLGLILVPLSLAMARSAGPAPIAATDLGQAIGETLNAGQDGPGLGLGRLSGTAIIALIWFIVATFGIFGLLAAVQSLDSEGYAAAFGSFGTPLGILLLTAWVATIVAGTRLTVRAIFGERPRPNRRR